jgi:hypothetical protein
VAAPTTSKAQRSSPRPAPPPSSPSRRLLKVGLAVGALAIFGFLFLRSIRQSRSAPYAVPRDQLAGWRLVVDATGPPTAPLLMLRAPNSFAGGLFGQLFKRAMESLRSPAEPGIPLVLHGEFGRALSGRVTPEALLAAARAAGLEDTPVAPRCLGYRRASDKNGTRQIHFVLFDMPAFARFRQQVGALAGGASDFDPATLSPIMLLASADTSFDDWLPLQADLGRDCVAPIVTE